MSKKPPRIIEHYDGDTDFVSGQETALFSEAKKGLVVDIETTGLNFDGDQIIELGLVSFEYNPKTGEILKVLETKDFLQDPGKPLSQEIIKITGLTDKILKGHSLDKKEIDRLFKDADLVVAHNASFDRNFINEVFPSSRNKVWACSKDDIPWRDLGHDCRTLQHLCNDFLFYYDGHRAEIDCLATLKLLSQKDHVNGNLLLSYVLKTASKKSYTVNAVKAPFESKDLLKNAGYRWNPDKKFWYKTISEEELAENNKVLKEAYRSASAKPEIIEVLLTDRFLLKK